MAMGTQNGITKRREGIILVFVTVFIALSLFCLAPRTAFADEPTEQSQEISAQQQEAAVESNIKNSTKTDDPQEETYDSDDVIDAQTNQSGAYIPDTDIPLTGTITTTQATPQGSILNTLLVAVCSISMLTMLIALFFSKTKDYRVLAIRMIAVALGLVLIASWSLVDTLQTPSQLVNEATVFMSALFSAYAIVFVYSYIYEKRLKKTSSLEDT